MASSAIYFFNLHCWSMKGSVNRADISSSSLQHALMLPESLHSARPLIPSPSSPNSSLVHLYLFPQTVQILCKPSAVPHASSTFLSLLQTQHFQGTGEKICSLYLFIFWELIDLPSPVFSAWKQEARRQIAHTINFPPKQLVKSKLFGCSFF